MRVHRPGDTLDLGVTRPRVVLAEDHPAVAAELCGLLTTDYEVVDIVHDGRALIEAARRVLPDAIVCDIAMPGINGLAAAAAILDARPNIRIVFVTVQDDRAVITRALACGALGYVVKSDAGEELVNAVRTAMQGGCYLSANARYALGRIARRIDD